MTPSIAPSSPIPAEATANSHSLVRNVGFPRLRASGSLPPTAIRRRPYGRAVDPPDEGEDRDDDDGS